MKNNFLKRNWSEVFNDCGIAEAQVKVLLEKVGSDLRSK
jgi:hypothetical protein